MAAIRVPLGGGEHGGGGRVGYGVVGGFEAVDVGVELALVSLEIEAAVGVEGEDWVVLEDDARWRAEALDVEEGEADALVGELGLGGIGLAAVEAIETVGAVGVKVAFGIEVECVTAIEVDVHGVLRASVNIVDGLILATINLEHFECCTNHRLMRSNPHIENRDVGCDDERRAIIVSAEAAWPC